MRFLTSSLLARAPIRVSGVPQSPNPKQGRKECITPANVHENQIYEPPLSSVSPDLTSLIASSTESQTLRLRGTGASAATLKHLSVCDDQVARRLVWSILVIRARYATVDGCLDIDLRSIFCRVVTGMVQVSREAFNTHSHGVLRIMIMVRRKVSEDEVMGFRSTHCYNDVIFQILQKEFRPPLRSHPCWCSRT